MKDTLNRNTSSKLRFQSIFIVVRFRVRVTFFHDSTTWWSCSSNKLSVHEGEGVLCYRPIKVDRPAGLCMGIGCGLEMHHSYQIFVRDTLRQQ